MLFLRSSFFYMVAEESAMVGGGRPVWYWEEWKSVKEFEILEKLEVCVIRWRSV